MDQDQVSSHESIAKMLEAGDVSGALCMAVPMLEAAPGDLVVWHQVLEALVAMGAGKDTLVFWPQLAEAWAGTMNLPMALACALEFRDAGGNPNLVFGELARLYSKTSDRLSNADLPPPPIPGGRGVPPLEEVSEKKLKNMAKDTCFLAVAAAEAIAAGSEKLPAMPLWSMLESDAFTDLASELEIIRASEEQVIIREGDPGDALYLIARGGVRVWKEDASGEERELAKLSSGAFVGEMSIVSSAPRVANVSASIGAIFLKLSRQSLDTLVSRHASMGEVLVAFCHSRMLENLLRTSPVLSAVPAEKRTDLLSMFETRKVEAGKLILRQGKEGPGLCLIANGSVSVYREDNGEKLVLAQLAPGNIFGEISLVMQKPVTANVRAEEDTLMLFLPRERFLDAVKAYPELLSSAYQTAIERDAVTSSILAQDAVDADDLILV